MAIVGGGPAGLTAARVAAESRLRVIVFERARHPRYKTCGGGLVGTSVAHAGRAGSIPVRDVVTTATFTLDGTSAFTRTSPDQPLLSMISRDEFDMVLKNSAATAGAEIRENSVVRGIEESGGKVTLRLADGTTAVARSVVGADGSSGISARHVGVEYQQTDLGLELELPLTGHRAAEWQGRMLLDWGPIPGSYGWVFPKSDSITIGVIAERGGGDATKAYLRDFVARNRFENETPLRDSGHLTRCRTPDSPLGRGHVLVVGDAAGLLEPWTREGISYALRSGEAAGKAVSEWISSAAPPGSLLPRYVHRIEQTLVPEMAAGSRLFAAFRATPALLHLAMASPPGWRVFTEFCNSEIGFESALKRRRARVGMSILDKIGAPLEASVRALRRFQSR